MTKRHLAIGLAFVCATEPPNQLLQQDLLTITKDEITACHDMATTILDQTRDEDGEIPAEIEPELLCSLHVHYSAINRNKRCALAYLYALSLSPDSRNASHKQLTPTPRPLLSCYCCTVMC